MRFSEFPARRIAGVAGVVLLHVAVIGALVNAIYVSPPPQRAPAHDHIVWLILHPKVEPQKAKEKSAKPKAGLPAPQVSYPDYRTINLPPLTGETNLNGLHGLLFDCAPENLASLTPEERAQCTIASTRPPDDTKALMNQASKSKNPVRWARALQRKQNPTMLPCFPPSLASIFCAVRGIQDGGFDMDMEPNYGDKPQEVHVPNNGDEPHGHP